MGTTFITVVMSESGTLTIVPTITPRTPCTASITAGSL